MMMERYSKNQSKVQERYRRGQNDDGKVQQKFSPKFSRDTAEDRMIMERCSKNQSKV
jgi:hypothetical protein